MAKKQWVDGPILLMSSPPQAPEYSPDTIKVATEMTLAHNIFIRHLNATYLQYNHIHTPTDIQDFLTFAHAFYLAIHHHHWGEETFFFPVIEEYTKTPGLMAANIEQHAAFDEGLEKFEEYVGRVRGGEEEWDKDVFKAKLDGFAGVLESHLREEIGTLLGLEKFGGAKLMFAWRGLEKAVMDIKNKDLILPFVLGANDRTFDGGLHSWFPPFPFFVPYLVKWWYMRGKYSGAWRFCPCDVFGQPRDLEFLGEE